MWYIVSHLIHNDYIQQQNITEVLMKLWDILKKYNNNYRPIYHLENFLFYLIKKVHEL